MNARVRIAPSPTGNPHVGTAYIALFNMIFAKKNKGTFVLRIEDTDQTRSKAEYEQNIYDALNWCGITWDEGPDVGGEYGPYKQSERLGIYKKYVDQLIKNDKAYKCFTTAEELATMKEIQIKTKQKLGYDRRHRNLSPDEIKEMESKNMPYVVRLKVPLNGTISFKDAIRGHIEVPCEDIDDQVILKSDGFPTYHLANIVDDHLMKITHVIRGDEWISSTPKHILLYNAFNWDIPEFIHMPLLLGVDGKKLSKRKHPTSIFYYKKAGYLPETMINFLTLMGYSMPGEEEIYPLEELINSFDQKHIGTSGAVFDIKKLQWMNQQYIINKTTPQTLWNQITHWAFPEDTVQQLMNLCHTRMKTFADFVPLSDFLFKDRIEHTPELFEKIKLPIKSQAILLRIFLWEMEKIGLWSKDSIELVIKTLSEKLKLNLKKVVIPLFYASIMGKKNGLPMFASIELLQQERARIRIQDSIDNLSPLSKKQQKQLQKQIDKELTPDVFDI
jgi:glutamyl-tRNA synthetase